jgi:hypothetical protein
MTTAEIQARALDRAQHNGSTANYDAPPAAQPEPTPTK